MNWDRRLPDDVDLGLVRPYALTGGRTHAAVDDLAIETMIVAVTDAATGDPGYEHRRILELCEHPLSLAEVAALVGIPLGVARVLVADLVVDGAVQVHGGSRVRPDRALLSRVLDGLCP
jgi:hypothetical protein